MKFKHVRPNNRKSPVVHFELLESRVLYSADVVSGLGFNLSSAADDLIIDHNWPPNGGQTSLLPVAEPASVNFKPTISVSEPETGVQNSSSQMDELIPEASDAPLVVDNSIRELVFIDSRTPDFQSMVDDLHANRPETEFELVIIDSAEDGIDKISTTLSSLDQVTAIHIISHGSNGAVQLGAVTLNEFVLNERGGELQQWSSALSDDADVLIYGCNLAATEDGVRLVNNIASLTNADVAASDDITGHESLGGNWELEYVKGNVSTDIVFTPDLQANWVAKLDTVIVTSFNDIIDSDTSSVAALLADPGADGISLREAIIATNKSFSDADIIILESGTYELSIQGIEKDALAGDLDINSDLQIIGAIDGSTVIDAKGIDRVFEVRNNTTTFENLTIQGGNSIAGTSSGGGGVFIGGSGTAVFDSVVVRNNNTNDRGGGIRSGGNLTVSDTVITGNTANEGGGIVLTSGTATVDGTTISDNTAAFRGGGVLTASGSSHQFINTTISGNEAAEGGGFASSSASTAFINSTITDNKATVEGGGIDRNNGTVTLDGSIVAGNTAPSQVEVSGNGGIASLGNNIIGDDPGDSASNVNHNSSDILDETGLLLGPLADNGGLVQTHALLPGSAGIDPGNNSGSAGIDGRGFARDANPDTGAFEFGATPETTLLIATAEDVAAPSGTSGIDSWSSGDVLEISDLAIEPGTSDGTFGSLADFNSLASDGAAEIDAIHYVSTDITVGGANSVALKQGDLLLSVATSEMFTSTNSLSVTAGDVFVFSPDTDGDYSSGKFTFLLQGGGGSPVPNGVKGITLIETAVNVAGDNLQAGDFLFTKTGAPAGQRSDVFHLSTTEVGDGTTAGTVSTLVDGSSVQINRDIVGIDLVESATKINGITIPQGSLIVSTDDSDNITGDNGISTQASDIFYLDIIKTGNNGNADANLLFEGADAGLDTTEENINALSLSAAGSVPQIQAPNNAPESNTDIAVGAEDNVLSFSISATDADGTVDSFRINTLASNGILFSDAGLSSVVAINDVIPANASGAADLWFAPDPNSNGSTNFEFTAIDNQGEEDATPAIQTLDITAVNDPPSIDLDANDSSGVPGSDYQISYDAGSGSRPVSDVDVILADVDSPQLNSITIAITNTPDGTDESLSATVGGTGITATTQGNGVLLLSGQATISDYETVLKTIRYSNLSTTPNLTTRDITFTVNDGLEDSLIATAMVSILPDTVAPNAVINAGTDVNEGSSIVIDNSALRYSDLQPEESISYSLVGLPNNGHLAFSAASDIPITSFTQAAIDDGEVIYVHSGSETLTDSFEFTVDDSLGNVTALDSFNIIVNPVNDPPQGSSNLLVLSEDTQHEFIPSQFGFSDTNEGDGFQSVVITTVPENGALTLFGSQLTDGDEVLFADIDDLVYQPFTDVVGVAADAFTFQVRDNNGDSNGGESLDPTPNTITFDITAVNDAPKVDLDGDNSSGRADADYTTSFLVGGSPQPIGDPADTFIRDVDSNTLSSLTVTLTNRPDGLSEILRANLTAGLTGGYDSQTGVYSVIGTAPVSAYEQILKSISYENQSESPDTTTRMIEVVVEDTDNSLSAVATSFIEIVPEVVAPVLINNTGAVLSEGGDVVIGAGALTFDDLQTDNAITYTINSSVFNGALSLLTDPSGAPVTSFTQADINAGSLIYTHDGTETLTDAFEFVVSDGIGNTTASQIFNISVTPVNEPPAGRDNTLIINEDTPRSFAAGDFGFFDASEGDSFQSVVITTLPTGSLTLNSIPVVIGDEIAVTELPDLTYLPVQEVNGINADSFTFQVRDDGGTANGGADLDPDFNTLEFDVSAINDTPVISTIETSPLVYIENSGANVISSTLNVLDLDNAVLESAIVQISDNFNSAEDVLAFTDTANITHSWDPQTGSLLLNGTDTVASYQSALRSVTYINSSDDPITTARTIDFTVTDADQGLSNLVQRELQVVAVNDEPSGTDNTVTTLEDTSYVFSAIDFGFSDNLDNHALDSLIITSVPNQGFLVLDNTPLSAGDSVSGADIDTGLLVYIPQANASGSGVATFEFQVRDTGGTLNSGIDTDTTSNTITIDVTQVNDAPAGKDSLLTGLEDSGITLKVSDFGYSDIDFNNFEAVILESTPSRGQLMLNGAVISEGDLIQLSDISAGNLVYLPGTNEHGTPYADFEFRVRDDGGELNGGANTAQLVNVIEFSIAEVNDAPTGADTLISIAGETLHTFLLAEFPFTDVDGDQLAGIVINSLPEAGTLLLNNNPVAIGDFITVTEIGNGNFTLLPDAVDPVNTINGFDYQLRDNGGTLNGGTDTGVLANRISYTIMNQPPEIITNAASVDEGDEFTITEEFLSGVDPDDTDPQELNFTVTKFPLNGELRLSGSALSAADSFSLEDIIAGRISYEHDGSETESDLIEFSLADGGEDGALPSEGQLSLLIREVIDEAPAVENDELFLTFGETFNSANGDMLSSGNNLLSAALLRDNPEFILEVEEGPEQGMLNLLPNGAFTYEHNGSVNRVDQFSYRITNEDGVFSIATVDITVEPPLDFAFGIGAEPIATGSINEPSQMNPDSTEDSTELEVEQGEDLSAMMEEVTGESEATLAEFEFPVQASSDSDASVLPDPGVSIIQFEFESELTGRSESLLAALDVIKHNAVSISEFNSVSSEVELQRIDVEFQIDDHRVGISNNNFLRALRQIDSDLQEAESEKSLKIQLSGDAVFGFSISATAGVVAWALRGGALLASVMAVTPVWASVDPHRVLKSSDHKESNQGSSEVEKIFE